METPEIMSQHSSGKSGLIRALARALLRQRTVGALATAEAGTNHPYASLITVATDTDASPIFLISRLALHTRNLVADPRASILFAAEAGPGDPLNLGRVSVIGRAEPTDNARVRSRFLARHPSAALYADFADFAFWRLHIERAHFVGGFGRIETLAAPELLVDPDIARDWDARIDSAIEAVNAAQSPLIAQLAEGVAAPDAIWRIAACDPDGCDLLCGEETHRLGFPGPLSSPEGLAAALIGLAHQSPKPRVN